jgi:hypothetical protein
MVVMGTVGEAEGAALADMVPTITALTMAATTRTPPRIRPHTGIRTQKPYPIRSPRRHRP